MRDAADRSAVAPLVKKLQEVRPAKSMKELAEQISWTPSKLIKILHGQQMIRADELAVLLDAFEVSPEQSAELRTMLLEAEESLSALRDRRRHIRSTMFEAEGESPVVREGRVGFESSDDPDRQVMVQYREEVERDIASNLAGARRRLIGYHSLRFAALTFTAITPALAAFEAPSPLTVAAGCVALLSTGAIQLTQLHERALVDQRRASALHRQVRLYRTGAGEYAAEARDALLVERVEAIREEGDNGRIAVTQQAFGAPSVSSPPPAA